MRDDHDSGHHAARQLIEMLELRLAEERTMIERLAEERARIFEAIDALAQQRDFVREAVEQAIAKLRAEEIVRLWASVTAAHTAILGIQKDRLAEVVASERPAAAKLN